MDIMLVHAMQKFGVFEDDKPLCDRKDSECCRRCSNLDVSDGPMEGSDDFQLNSLACTHLTDFLILEARE
jgi:hypothetical protein